METVIAILLYLQLIFSPGTYKQSYINRLQYENQARIDEVQRDPAQMEIVDQQYRPQVKGVVIINDTGEN